MEISSFTVKNFKGIGEDGITINFAPITLLFGANNSGKSSAIQALFFAREVLCNGNINPDTVQGGGRAIKLGCFPNFVHNHELTRTVILRFDINFNEGIRYGYNNDEGESILLSTFSNLFSYYADEFLRLNISKIRNMSFEISISWDFIKEIPYISNRKIYVNNILILSFDTKLGDNKTIFDGLSNNIFNYIYDGGVITNEICEDLCKKHFDIEIKHNKSLKDRYIYESEHNAYKNLINIIIDKKYDYKMFRHIKKFISSDASIESYSIVSYLVLFALIGHNKTICFDNFKNSIKNISNNCREFLFGNMDCQYFYDFEDLPEYDDMDRETYRNEIRNRAHKESEERCFKKISNFINKYNIDNLHNNYFSIDFDKDEIKYHCNIINDIFDTDILRFHLKFLIFTPIKLIKDKLKEILYIGTQRVTIERHFNPETIQALTWANGMAAWHELMNKPDLVDKVNKEIPKVLGSDFDLRLAHLKDVSIDMTQFASKLNNIKMQSEPITPEYLTQLLSEIGADMHNRVFFVNKSGTFLSPNDLGHGISQIIPILVAPQLPDNNSNIVVIEEPESNIHPAWQVELAEFFLRITCRHNEDNTTESTSSVNSEQPSENQPKNAPPILLLETHSEHIMLRILRRIRETYENELPEGAQSAYPQDVAVHYIQRNMEGNTQVIHMEITSDGDFSSRWPKGFFEERAEELF